MRLLAELARAGFGLLRRLPWLSRLTLPWALAHLSFALPSKRLRETPTLIAFHHPRPSYPLHILIVPKKAIPDLAGLGPQDAGLLSEVLEMAQGLVQEFHLQEKGYRLIVNGGAYQEIPQLHFHLVSV